MPKKLAKHKKTQKKPKVVGFDGEYWEPLPIEDLRLMDPYDLLYAPVERMGEETYCRCEDGAKRGHQHWTRHGACAWDAPPYSHSHCPGIYWSSMGKKLLCLCECHQGEYWPDEPLHERYERLFGHPLRAQLGTPKPAKQLTERQRKVARKIAKKLKVGPPVTDPLIPQRSKKKGPKKKRAK